MSSLRLSKLLLFHVCVSCVAFATAANADVRQGTAVAKTVRGSASYIDELGGLHPLMEGTILKEGCTIKTGAGSSVDLVMEDNGRYVGLFEDSVLSFTKLTYQPSPLGNVFDTRMDLKQGRILASVSKLLAGARYELKTPQGLASVRGTEFYYDGKTGQIWVISGTVHLDLRLLDVGTPPPPHDEKTTIDIPAGTTLYVTREIDMLNFRGPPGSPPGTPGTILPTYTGIFSSAGIPADVITRINNTPLLGGHYNNAGNTEVGIKAAWFTELNPRANTVNLIGIPALVIPSP